MSRTSSRCDRILALIDACLAYIETPTGDSRPSGSPASRSPRLVPVSQA